MLGKLIVAQLLNEIPTVYVTRLFFTVLTRTSQRLNSVLNY